MSTLDWRWTSPERIEARADRWFAFFVHNEWRVGHDDFPLRRPLCLAHEGTSNASGLHVDEIAREVLRDFLAWLASQSAPQPPEPTRFGYVGYVVHDGDERRWQILRTQHSGSVTYSIVNPEHGYPFPRNSWASVIQRATFTAVTP